MSTMLIDNITASLNGTHIDCWFNEGRSTRIIDVVGNGSFTVHKTTVIRFGEIQSLDLRMYADT